MKALRNPLVKVVLKAVMFWITGLYLFGYIYWPVRFGAMDALLPSEIAGMVILAGAYFGWSTWLLIQVIRLIHEEVRSSEKD